MTGQPNNPTSLIYHFRFFYLSQVCGVKGLFSLTFKVDVTLFVNCQARLHPLMLIPASLHAILTQKILIKGSTYCSLNNTSQYLVLTFDNTIQGP